MLLENAAATLWLADKRMRRATFHARRRRAHHELVSFFLVFQAHARACQRTPWITSRSTTVASCSRPSRAHHWYLPPASGPDRVRARQTHRPGRVEGAQSARVKQGTHPHQPMIIRHCVKAPKAGHTIANALFEG